MEGLKFLNWILEERYRFDAFYPGWYIGGQTDGPFLSNETLYDLYLQSETPPIGTHIVRTYLVKQPLLNGQIANRLAHETQNGDFYLQVGDNISKLTVKQFMNLLVTDIG